MARQIEGREKIKRELIRLTYVCATDPAQLPELLAAYTKAVGADGSGLVVQDLRNMRGNVAESWGFDPAWERKYSEHYAKTNIWIQRMAPRLRPGVIHNSEGVIREDDFLHTEFYNDFLRPQRLFHSFGAAITREDDVTAFITSVRSRKAGCFQPAEHELCRELIPHLQAALRIRHHLAGLETQVKHLTAALDQLPQGIIVADAAAQVRFLNRSAEITVGARNGIWIAPNGLRALKREETARLRELLKRAASTITGDGDSAGGVMQISRPGCSSLKITIAPLHTGAYVSARQHAAIILIGGTQDREDGVDPRLLRQLFGFTPAESRLTAALVEGKSAKEFAEAAGVSLNTARTHLKNLFVKAGVKRQSALVREVLTALDQLGRNL
jgi:DNA-binding CsgD family transcriptional regulator/PAS domain-containing protein